MNFRSFMKLRLGFGKKSFRERFDPIKEKEKLSEWTCFGEERILSNLTERFILKLYAKEDIDTLPEMQGSSDKISISLSSNYKTDTKLHIVEILRKNISEIGDSGLIVQERSSFVRFLGPLPWIPHIMPWSPQFSESDSS